MIKMKLKTNSEKGRTKKDGQKRRINKRTFSSSSSQKVFFFKSPRFVFVTLRFFFLFKILLQNSL